MEITNLILSDYIDGQIEIKNEANGTNRRGQIKNIAFGNHPQKITVECDWFALMDEPEHQTGIRLPMHYYFIDYSLYNAYRLGPDETGNNNLLIFQSDFIDDFVILYPPGENLVDATDIRNS